MKRTASERSLSTTSGAKRSRSDETDAVAADTREEISPLSPLAPLAQLSDERVEFRVRGRDDEVVMRVMVRRGDILPDTYLASASVNASVVNVWDLTPERFSTVVRLETRRESFESITVMRLPPQERSHANVWVWKTYKKFVEDARTWLNGLLTTNAERDELQINVVIYPTNQMTFTLNDRAIAREIFTRLAEHEFELRCEWKRYTTKSCEFETLYCSERGRVETKHVGSDVFHHLIITPIFFLYTSSASSSFISFRVTLKWV